MVTYDVVKMTATWWALFVVSSADSRVVVMIHQNTSTAAKC